MTTWNNLRKVSIVRKLPVSVSDERGISLEGADTMNQSREAKNGDRLGAFPLGSRTVTFFCHAPSAREVFLVGTFNDWEPTATPMERNSKGEWCVCLDLFPGEIEYSAIIDGRRYSEAAYAIVEADPQLCQREISIVPDMSSEKKNPPRQTPHRSRSLGTVS